MPDCAEQARILAESKVRVKAMQFGDPVTNICAGEGNPTRHSWFVQYVVKTRTNSWGIAHSEYWAKCTDRKGKFFNMDVEVIHPGHLSVEEAGRLFKPVWQAKFGEKQPEPQEK